MIVITPSANTTIGSQCPNCRYYSQCNQLTCYLYSNTTAVVNNQELTTPPNSALPNEKPRTRIYKPPPTPVVRQFNNRFIPVRQEFRARSNPRG